MQLARLIFTLITLLICSTSFAKEKIALVIGNADYTSSALVNSVNDAEDIASTLEGLDFGVTLVKNATKGQMQAAISEFIGNLNDDTVGLFYYSGHAVQYKGNNYLIPIGSMSKVDRSENLSKHTTNMNTVLNGLNQSQSGLNFIFLDACRDSPFENLSKEILPGLASPYINTKKNALKSTMDGAIATRGISKKHKNVKNIQGVLVAYSTVPGGVASDGDINSRNSPYTKSILKNIYKENVPITSMLVNVMSDVYLESDKSQSPTFETTITGNFCFNEVGDGCGKSVVNIHSSYLNGIKNIQKLTLLDGSIYEGQVLNSKPHGKGVQVYSNDNRYEGEWKEGAKHGSGILINDIGRYEGSFSQGLPNGEGIEVWSNGHRYEGEWRDNKRHGKGFYSWTDGSSYEGGWENGNEHGFGIIRNLHEDLSIEANFVDGYPDGKMTTKFKGNTAEYEIDLTPELKRIFDSEKAIPLEYINGHVIIVSPLYRFDGNQVNGLKSGFGIQVWSTGDRYEGEWKNNKQDGKGIANYSFGGRYDGLWKDNEFHGYGIFNSSGGHRYEGEWKKGKMNGYFIVNTSNGNTYKGELVNNYFHGKGAYNWADGNSYTGDWKNGKHNGKGVYIYGNTDDSSMSGMYEGDFKNDVRHGYGIRTWKNGDRYEGEWQNDKYHGRGVATTLGGYRYEGEWINGKEVGN